LILGSPLLFPSFFPSLHVHGFHSVIFPPPLSLRGRGRALGNRGGFCSPFFPPLPSPFYLTGPYNVPFPSRVEYSRVRVENYEECRLLSFFPFILYLSFDFFFSFSFLPPLSPGEEQIKNAFSSFPFSLPSP